MNNPGTNICHLFWKMCITVLFVITLPSPSPVQAQADPPTSPAPRRLAREEARQAAQARIEAQVAMGYTPGWADAQLAAGVTLYDLSGAVSAYLFPVQRAGESAGYLTVVAFDVPNPVLEFSATAASPLLTRRALAEEIARTEGQTLCSDRPLYAGPLSYGYELAPNGDCTARSAARRLVDLFDGRVVVIGAEQAAVPLAHSLALSVTVETETVTTPAAYKLIGGVPDYCQFWGSYGCWSGCAPTASANVLGYWDGQGYPDLQSGGNWQSLVNTLRGYMDTQCDGSSGSTNIGNISPGMVNYAHDQGYHFESQLDWPGAPYSLLRAEIDAGCPIVVDLIGAVEYWNANHSVTGVGYQTAGSYMIVHDALSCGSNQGNHYIHYGSSWYDSIGMHPTAPDRTAPTQATNVRPDGWTGPYTSDTTPRFKWNAAQDSGSGVAGYHVAVNDWTPDSNDWWAENTAFTVPNALSDGAYHFAVTSKDNAGNVNPANTNTKGDAPYYSFVVDTTAPDNPRTVEAGCSAQDGVWQRECTNPSFSWEGANDHGGAGVQDYHIYWGTDPDGAPDVWRSDADYDPDAIDSSDLVVTYYLRVATRDTLGHESAPETMFTLRYDAAAPTAAPIINGGREIVHTVNVLVEPNGQDAGSGLADVQLSNDGTDWHAQDYASTLAWHLPPQNHAWHTVWIKVKDKVGNPSQHYTRKVCLELYPAHPSSAHYRLWSAGPTAGGGRLASNNYRLDQSVGQSSGGGLFSSNSYRLQSGFQSTGLARPGAEMFTPTGCDTFIYLPLVLKQH